MKNFFHRWGTSLALLCLLGSVSFAQVISSSIQLSQDPRGPFGVDINNGVYFPGHILTPAGRPPPAIGTCGTSPSVIGTDTAGKATTGSTATTACTITFGTAFVTAPACVVSPDSSMAVTSAVFGVATTTTLVVTYASSTSSKFDYICMSPS